MSGFSSAELKRASTASLERAVNLLIDRIPNTRKGETRKAMSEQFAQICGELSQRGMRIEVPSFLASEIRHERGMQAQIRWIKKNLGLPKQEAASVPTVQVTSSSSKAQPRNAFSNFGDALKNGGLINEFTADYLKGRHSGIATLSNFDRDAFLLTSSSPDDASSQEANTAATELTALSAADEVTLDLMTTPASAEPGELYSDDGLLDAIAPAGSSLSTDKPRIRLSPKVTLQGQAGELTRSAPIQKNNPSTEPRKDASATASSNSNSSEDWMNLI